MFKFVHYLKLVATVLVVNSIFMAVVVDIASNACKVNI